MRCLLFIAFNFYDYKLSHGDENKNKTSLFMREKKIIGMYNSIQLKNYFNQIERMKIVNC